MDKRRFYLMKMNKLNKAVLKLWYIRAAILALALVGATVSLPVIMIAAEAQTNVILAVSLGAGVPLLLIFCLVLNF